MACKMEMEPQSAIYRFSDFHAKRCTDLQVELAEAGDEFLVARDKLEHILDSWTTCPT